MKTYTKPEITVSVISSTESVLATSGGIVVSKFDAKKSGKGYSEVTF